MKTKLAYLIPIAITAVVLFNIDLELIHLKSISDIELSTLFMSFPVILALTERFNEVFIVSKTATKEGNIHKTTLASFSVGIVLAIAGFRILETFMEVPSEAFTIQAIVFKFVDTVLTAVVIAGGTDGWHQIIGLIQDITKSKREEAKSTKTE
ncbi:hypothetical protein EV195_107209 [Tenacibaculum skagerrakense]|uniref:Uncharacterized protein n=1 Tax=Tenacibaculum skagerrakense TaxID=186571 RepID=A0A4R2NQC8_9FLAO|nr:hypothetical protein [Tenacibaculum skagerrakense]TCP24043.1 hypothetical protein EV195_107209 [Tenacibaculum skagerrakense]